MDKSWCNISDSPDILGGAIFQVSDAESEWDAETDGEDVIHSSQSKSFELHNTESNFIQKTISTTVTECKPCVSFANTAHSVSKGDALWSTQTCNSERDLKTETDAFNVIKNLTVNDANSGYKNDQAERMCTSFSQTFDVADWSSLSDTVDLTRTAVHDDQTRGDSSIIKKVKTALDINPAHKANLINLKCMQCDHIYENVVACVLHCYPVKEVWIKSRGCWQCMCVVLLTDSSGVCMKLTLWDSQCSYAFVIQSGDLILIQSAKVKRIMMENCLSLYRQSVVICMGSAKTLFKLKTNNSLFRLLNDNCKEMLENIYKNSTHFFNVYPSIFSHPVEIALPPRNQTKHHEICRRLCGKLINVQLAVVGVKRHKSDSKNAPNILYAHFSSNCVQFCQLYLHGSCSEWIKQFSVMRKHLWEFRNVACCTSSSTDRLELHTTVFSSAHCVNEGKTLFNICRTPSLRSYGWACCAQTPSRLLLTDVTVQCVTLLFSTRHIRLYKHSSKAAKMRWFKRLFQSHRKGTALHGVRMKCVPKNSVGISNYVDVSVNTIRSLLITTKSFTQGHDVSSANAN